MFDCLVFAPNFVINGYSREAIFKAVFILKISLKLLEIWSDGMFLKLPEAYIISPDSFLHSREKKIGRLDLILF